MTVFFLSRKGAEKKRVALAEEGLAPIGDLRCNCRWI
jgi:hypothetical protein